MLWKTNPTVDDSLIHFLNDSCCSTEPNMKPMVSFLTQQQQQAEEEEEEVW